MSESRTIAAMLQASIDGPAWHGPAAMEILDSVTADQARRRVADDAHTIWEIVHHMIAWQEYALRVLDGGSADPLEGEADWPPLPSKPTEEAWEASRRRLEGVQRDLRERMQRVPPLADRAASAAGRARPRPRCRQGDG